MIFFVSLSMPYMSLLWSAEEDVTMQINASNFGYWLSLSWTLSLSVCLRFIVLAACVVFLCALDDIQLAFNLKDVMPMETVSTPTPNILLTALDCHSRKLLSLRIIKKCWHWSLNLTFLKNSHQPMTRHSYHSLLLSELLANAIFSL